MNIQYNFEKILLCIDNTVAFLNFGNTFSIKEMMNIEINQPFYLGLGIVMISDNLSFQ